MLLHNCYHNDHVVIYICTNYFILYELWCRSCNKWICFFQSNNTFCKSLEKNKELREEIDSLRVERRRFENLFKKLEKELNQLRQEIGEVIDQSTQAYDAREEAQAKMILLKEKADKDLQQHNTEMKELVRIIDHDRKLREFMNMKSKERQEDPQLVAWRQRKGRVVSDQEYTWCHDQEANYMMIR